jgi:Cys-rich four helix bundle protein (predicted Tat secretion target)
MAGKENATQCRTLTDPSIMYRFSLYLSLYHRGYNEEKIMQKEPTNTDATEEMSTERREFLVGAGMAAVAAATLGASGTVAAADGAHKHHTTSNNGLVDAARDCVAKGNACILHCMQLIKAGDTTIAECAIQVQQTVEYCSAFAYLAGADSAQLKGLTKICMDICDDCEKVCREHEDKHAECKACAESCADSIAACKKYLSAA